MEHDLEFSIVDNFAKVQDAKAAQKQGLAINLLANQEVREKWSNGKLDLLEKRALLDLPMDRPLAGLVLDVHALGKNVQKKAHPEKCGHAHQGE